MILYKGKAKDYSLENLRQSIAKRYGVIINKKITLSELEITAITSRERLEKWQHIIQKKKS